MKKLHFFIALCLTNIVLQAQTSSLTLRLWDNNMFVVVLDGNEYGTPSTQFVFNSLTEGTHHLKVTKQLQSSSGMLAYQQIYDADIDIPPHSEVKAQIDAYRRFEVLSVISTIGAAGSSYKLMSQAEMDNLMMSLSPTPFENDKLNMAKQATRDRWVTTAQVYQILQVFTFENTRLDFAKHAYPITTDKANYHKVNKAFNFSSNIDELTVFINGYNSNYYASGAASSAMTDYDFQGLIETLQQTSFDSDRYTIARQAASSNNFTAEQIYEVMILFSFERSKLDFAKLAYKKCVDRQNYFKVNRAFTFSTSVNDLDNYIKGQ